MKLNVCLMYLAIPWKPSSCLTTSISNICVPSLTGELQGALQTALAGGPASEDQGASNRRAGDLR